MCKRLSVQATFFIFKPNEHVYYYRGRNWKKNGNESPKAISFTEGKTCSATHTGTFSRS